MTQTPPGLDLTAEVITLAEALGPFPHARLDPTTAAVPVPVPPGAAPDPGGSDQAANAHLRIDFTFTDLGEIWTVWVKRGVLNARRGASPDTQLTVSGPKAALVGVVLQPAVAAQLAQAGKIQLDGDESVLTTFAGLMDEFDPNFSIVTP
jgi:Alkyl sulfatase C-terminal